MTQPSEPKEPSSARRAWSDIEQVLLEVRGALRGLEFGELSIKVQDGMVVQIERIERKRLRRKDGA